jgi:DNA polymerase-3 subunit beta
MKFSVEKATLLQSLQHVNKAIPTRSTLPILSCALFEIIEEQLLIRATNLEVYISVKINVEGLAAGKIAIPLNTLLDITNAMPEEFLHFEISDIGKVNIKSTCGKYTIMGQPADEFPSEPLVEKGNNLVVPSIGFNEIIESTIYATSKDDLKHVLQGVLVNMSPEGLIAVATDGHRLVRLKKTALKSGSFEGSVIIPVKFLSLLKPFLKKDESLSLQIGENHIMVNLNSVRVSSRIIKDRYPDYEGVIPKNNESELTINKNALQGSVKRVSIFSNKSTKQIALSLDINKITISTEDPENITTGKESIDCLYSGEPMVIGYNSQYLGDVLKNQNSEEIKILFNSPLSAGIFLPKEQLDDEEKTTLLMPIRLND